MPDPPRLPVVPLGEHLLQPLHDSRKFKPVRRLDIEAQPVIFKTERADLEFKPPLRPAKDLGKKRQSRRIPEQRFPVVDTGTDFVPYPLFENS
jgi:hypothetical protein